MSARERFWWKAHTVLLILCLSLSTWLWISWRGLARDAMTAAERGTRIARECVGVLQGLTETPAPRVWFDGPRSTE